MWTDKIEGLPVKLITRLRTTLGDSGLAGGGRARWASSLHIRQGESLVVGELPQPAPVGRITKTMRPPPSD